MIEDGGAHHWLIDTLPANGFYHARCKKCGAEKDFLWEELRPRNFPTSRKPSPLLVIEPSKRPRGRPRKFGD